MKIFKNESGITLVELLAAIVLFGIISILAWRFFFQFTTFNEKAVTQNQLQQEANIILNTMHTVHTKCTIHDLGSDGSYIEIISNGADCSSINKRFDNSNIEYKLEKSINNTNVNVKLTLISKKDKKVQYKTATTFFKLSPN
ncbi:type II secretory pathway component PulJ [Solibacillus kalamii]|uniref:Prepilin-type N-terminal cleavage/methylation domain-containing protein n=1 Tax=Solibacillus kalamii TaxID=1748298 RepID=A0ABX3ZHV9_9BACL|nr:type II secretion system protein [Solibacillus kalamii]MBM7665431.1 type II secretory pathway component PulJ [Solibacillus kalamii]OUZ39261.1 hypothetical protein CBM15_08360 [Solibacillus kalamii]